MGSIRADIPQPIIYGPDRPDLTLVMHQGQPRPQSRTNQNLYLGSGDFTEDGTYAMGRLLVDRPECAEKHGLEGCPMVLRSGADGDELPHPPEYALCPGLETLKGYCGSQAGRHWTLRLSGRPPRGRYSLWARAIDAAGNQSRPLRLGRLRMR